MPPLEILRSLPNQAVPCLPGGTGMFVATQRTPWLKNPQCQGALCRALASCTAGLGTLMLGTSTAIEAWCADLAAMSTPTSWSRISPKNETPNKNPADAMTQNRNHVRGTFRMQVPQRNRQHAHVCSMPACAREGQEVDTLNIDNCPKLRDLLCGNL